MMALGSAVPMRRLVAVDARRDKYYTQICSPDGMPCEPPTARSFKACLALGVEDHDPKFTVIGTGAARICTPENSRLSADPAPHWPQAAVLAAHAACLTMDELASRPAAPIYLRPPDATPPDPRKNLVFAPAKDGCTGL